MKETSKLLKNLVPAERIELSWACGPRDFESRASTSFTTPARGLRYCIIHIISNEKIQSSK